MTQRRGFAAVKKAKQESDQNRAQYEAMRTRDLILMKDGEEAELWFIGSLDTEPYMVKVHTLRNVNKRKFGTDVCAHGFKNHDGCVECYAERKGDKRIGKARTNGVFSVVDTRFFHKRKNLEKTAESGGKYEKFDYYNCPSTEEEGDPDECKYCRKMKKYPRERRGRVKLRCGIQTLTAIMGLNTQLSRNCLSCNGKKTIKLLGYTNSKGKMRPDIDDVDNPDDWTPSYSCKRCDDPKPENIFSRPITIRRNGTGQDTSYTFTPGERVDMPEWLMEIEPLNLEKICVPRSADKQAEMLGIDNPFDENGGRRSKKRKGDEDEDEDSDDDEDDDTEDYNDSKEDPFDT